MRHAADPATSTVGFNDLHGAALQIVLVPQALGDHNTIARISA